MVTILIWFYIHHTKNIIFSNKQFQNKLYNLHQSHVFDDQRNIYLFSIYYKNHHSRFFSSKWPAKAPSIFADTDKDILGAQNLVYVSTKSGTKFIAQTRTVSEIQCEPAFHWRRILKFLQLQIGISIIFIKAILEYPYIWKVKSVARATALDNLKNVMVTYIILTTYDI